MRSSLATTRPAAPEDFDIPLDLAPDAVNWEHALATIIEDANEEDIHLLAARCRSPLGLLGGGNFEMTLLLLTKMCQLRYVSSRNSTPR